MRGAALPHTKRPAHPRRLALPPLPLLDFVHATSLAQVKQRGALMLGTDPQFAPFEFKNDAGEIVGFGVDIARAIAGDLGVPLKIGSVGFDALMPASITSGRVDLAMSGITITPERAGVVSFSNPYFRSAQVFITRKGNPKQFDWPVSSRQRARRSGVVWTSRSAPTLLTQPFMKFFVHSARLASVFIGTISIAAS